MPSRKNGSSAPPLMSEVVVVVAVSALSATFPPAPESSTRSVVPDGLETCRPAGAERAADLGERPMPKPPEKSMPMTLSPGSGRRAVGERQHARVVDAHQREGALRVGQRVRVGDGDRVAGQAASRCRGRTRTAIRSSPRCPRWCDPTARSTSRRRSGRAAPVRRSGRDRASRAAPRSCPSRSCLR